MIDSTLLGVNSNSYISIARLKTLLSFTYDANKDFEQLDDSELERLLIHATSEIESILFTGVKTVSNQALEWPRTAYDTDKVTLLFPANTIPLAIEKATVEMAKHIYKTSNAEDEENVKTIEIKGLKIEKHKRDTKEEGMPYKVSKLLSAYIADKEESFNSIQFNIARV